jgi:ribosomal protein L15
MEIGRETAPLANALCKAVLFVDAENAGTIDLSAIPNDVLVRFFFGASQKKVSTEFLRAAIKLGERFSETDVDGAGNNALDFHIAFYLGEHLAADPKANCIILSKDKGFDPLVKHLCKRGFAVRRASNLAEAFAPAKPKQAKQKIVSAAKANGQAATTFEDVVAWLTKMEPKVRPHKRKKLIAHLLSHFGKKSSEGELSVLVDRLVAEKKISDEGGKVWYSL